MPPQSNLPHAQVALALCFASGDGVDADGDAATDLLRAAAARGLSTAQYRLGRALPPTARRGGSRVVRCLFLHCSGAVRVCAPVGIDVRPTRVCPRRCVCSAAAMKPHAAWSEA